MTETQSFGRWLKRHRHAAGLTQPMLAAQMGYAVSTIRKLEQGERHPTRAFVTALAATLALMPDQFLALLRSAELAPLEPPLTILPAFAPPAVLASLVGRDALLAAVLHQLDMPSGRWTTLIGPPGVGKTQLAIAVAHEIGRVQHIPVVWLSLTTFTTVEDVLLALANALALPPSPHLMPDLMQALFAHDLFLVLDTAEHLVTQAHGLLDLIIHAPHLHFLATSRQAFNVAGEQIVVVPPLSTTPVHPAAMSDAALLLVQRLRTPPPLTPARIATYNAIAATTDGLPLALELVAAQRRIMALPFPPAHAAHSLHQTLPLNLTRAEQTVGAILDRSATLLAAETRLLWWWCGLFHGPFSADALHALAKGTPKGALEDALGQLQDHSLISPVEVTEDTTWYTQLELLRMYALAHLEAHGVRSQGEQRHAAYFLTLITACEQALRGGATHPALALMRTSQPDRAAALEWAFAAQHWSLAWALIEGQWTYWDQQGLWGYARRWLTRFLAQVPDQRDQIAASELLLICTVRQGAFAEAERIGLALIQGATERHDVPKLAKHWNNLGVIANRLGHLADAAAHYQQALGYYQSLGDAAHCLSVRENQAVQLMEIGLVRQAHESLLALQGALTAQGALEAQPRLQFYLGHIHLLEAHPAAAQTCFQQSLAAMTSQALPYWVALNQEGLARVALWRDELLVARDWAEQSLAALTQMGEPLWIVQCQVLLADIALLQEHPEDARRLADEALQQTEEMQVGLGMVAALMLQGRIAQGSAQVAEAQQWFDDAFTLATQLGDQTSIIHSLEGRAWVAGQQSDWPTARALLQTATTLRGDVGLAPSPREQQRNDLLGHTLASQRSP